MSDTNDYIAIKGEQVAELMAENEQLRAQNKRLMSRGIEDMKDEIERLRAALVNIVICPGLHGPDCCRNIAYKALEDDKRKPLAKGA